MFDVLAELVRQMLKDAANADRWREFQERSKDVIVTLELQKQDTVAQRVEREYCAVRKAADEWTPETEGRLIRAAEELIATLTTLQRNRHRLQSAGAEQQTRAVKPEDRERLVESYLQEHPEASARTVTEELRKQGYNTSLTRVKETEAWKKNQIARQRNEALRRLKDDDDF